MKVIVRCANNRVTKADMEREIERLFQENKDLRVYVGHLHDELSLAQQQSEARRQVICERDRLIDELNDQITACEEELTETNKTLEKKSAALAQVSAQRDNYEASYKQVCEWWGNEQTKARKAEETAGEYRIALMESDARVDELERRVEWLQAKNEEWAQVAVAHKNTIAAQKEEKEALEDVIRAFEETRKEYEEEIHAQHIEKREWMQKYEELKAQKEADDKKCEETCAACNERYEDVLAERNHLRKEVERLTYERDTVVKDNSELIIDNIELRDNLDAVINIKNEYSERIDEMSKKIIQLQSSDFTNQLANLILECFPSTDK